MLLPRFYLIIDDVRWLPMLIPAGVRLVQLRIKQADEAMLRNQIHIAKQCCERAGVQLIVNDYWQLALEAGCDFVHLGQEDLDGADIHALHRAGVRIGISTHDHAELERALTLQPAYVALGPVYPTTLKVMPWAPQGVARVREWKQRIGAIPLVAIGGLTIERAPDVYAAGADSIAVVSDVLRHPSPVQRTKEWMEMDHVN